MALPLLIALLAGVAVLLVFLGLLRFNSSDSAIAGRLNQYSVARPTAAAKTRPKQSTLMRGVERAVGNRTFAAGTAQALARADLKLTVSEFVVIHVIAVIGGFAIAYLLSRNPAFALLGAVIGLYIPGYYVRKRHQKRLTAFNSQLGDTVGLLANSLRSGYSLLQSMDMVSKEAPQPTREEFARVNREVSLGLSPEEALGNLVRRIDSDDFDLIVTAVNVQREVGGNLAQILDTIGTTIRERVRIKGEIKVLTSQQTLSGYVISILPIALGLLLFLINPSYVMQLFSTEKMICLPVLVLPICGALMMAVGFISIKKIVAIDV